MDIRDLVKPCKQCNGCGFTVDGRCKAHLDCDMCDGNGYALSPMAAFLLDELVARIWRKCFA
jgi:hypothetical protein